MAGGGKELGVGQKWGFRLACDPVVCPSVDSNVRRAIKFINKILSIFLNFGIHAKYPE